MSGDDEEEDDKEDLTRIEDLSEYLHEEDSETDRLLEEEEEEETPETSLHNLPEDSQDDLQDNFQDDEEEEYEEEPPPFDQGLEENLNLEDSPAEESLDEPLAEFSEEPPAEFPEEPQQEEFSQEFSEEATPAPLEDTPEEAPEEILEDPPEELEDSQETSFDAPQEAPREPSPPRENFQDLRDFGDSISHGLVSSGGNPPFSLILKGVHYEEDAQDILALLKEHGLCSEENEKTLILSLQNGHLLLSQISEYSAIYLAHRLRRFDIDIQVGLSDELHPSKSYPRESRGLVSKYSFQQSVNENIDLTSESPVEIESILLATTPTLEKYTIHRYIQVISSHSLVGEHELISTQESPQDPMTPGLSEVYERLTEELKNEAYKLKANAVVGINYHIAPLEAIEKSTQTVYKITCTGNAVWAVGDPN